MPYALDDPNSRIAILFSLLYSVFRTMDTHYLFGYFYLDFIGVYSKLYLFVVHRYDE